MATVTYADVSNAAALATWPNCRRRSRGCVRVQLLRALPPCVQAYNHSLLNGWETLRT